MNPKRFKKDVRFRREVKKMPCVACGETYGIDPCHIRTYGRSGLDEFYNVIPLCRLHHNMQHQIGWFRFCEKFPFVAALLKELGWVFLDANEKKILHNEKHPEANL